MTDEIKGLVERLKNAGACSPWRAGQPAPLLIEAAAALTLSDEARVRAEASFDALQQMVNAAKGNPWTAFRDFAARAQASEALVRELVEGLRPFAKFNLAGFDGEVLEVVPSTPDNPARRIEPIWTSHFRKAQALILRAENQETGASQSQPVLASNGHSEAEEPADRAPNTAPPGVLDPNYGRSIYSLLASAWFYGGWKAETSAERAMQAIMEQMGWWPIQGEGALMTMIGRDLGSVQRVDLSARPDCSAAQSLDGKGEL